MGFIFSLKPKGPVCCANHRYVKNGYELHYFMNNRHRAVKYKSSEKSNKRFLILREDINASAQQQNRLKIVKNAGIEIDFNIQIQ